MSANVTDQRRVFIDLTNSVRKHMDEQKDNDCFPDANFDVIADSGLHTLTIPTEYGGGGYGFEQTSEAIMSIAMICPSTALCMAMHYYTIAGLANVMPEAMKDDLFRNIVEKGLFMTSFNQPNVSIVQANQDLSNSTEIKITKVDGGYLVNGTKRFVSGITRFHYLPIYGNQQNVSGSRFGVTALLASIDDAGVSIKKSWSCEAMKATESHDAIFDNVYIPDHRLIGREGFGIEDTPSLVYWSRLAIASVYLGIAKSAIDHVIGLIKEKKDKISQKRMIFMPGVQFTVADLKIKFDAAHSQLTLFAQKADEASTSGNYSEDLFQKGLMMKYFVTHSSNEIIWQAMQIEGMSSLFTNSPLSRMYRDVRAATFHQPSDDLLKEVLAKKTLGLIAPKNRWL